MDQPLVRTAESVSALLVRPEVALRWEEPSSLAEMTVGALAAHLGAHVVLATRVLTRPVPPDTDRIGVIEHYERVKWRGAALDNDTNTAIRAGSESEAASGPDALDARVRSALEAFPAAWAGRTDWVYIPWSGWCLRPEDFLLTRLVEMTVHHDDLATSLGLAPIEPDATVVGPVVNLLTELARREHGGIAVVRALTRRERAPDSIAVM
jgi:hypothetical protein